MRAVRSVFLLCCFQVLKDRFIAREFVTALIFAVLKLALLLSPGTTSSFRTWQKALPDVLIATAALPGRMRRMGERALKDMPTLVDQLTTALLASGAVSGERPWAIFGHSMGSAVAYEVCLELARRRKAVPATPCVPPMLVIASGSRPPSWRAENRIAVPAAAAAESSEPATLQYAASPPDQVHLLSDEAFIEHLTALGGTPPEVLANRELMEFILPFLRADFQLINTYQPSTLVSDEDGHSPPLSAPLLVLSGRQDIGCPPQASRDWAVVTSGTAEVHEFDGGHFFIDNAEANGAMRTIDEKLCLLTKALASV
jgi:pyochelin biosynthetic protein PchC